MSEDSGSSRISFNHGVKAARLAEQLIDYLHGDSGEAWRCSPIETTRDLAAAVYHLVQVSETVTKPKKTAADEAKALSQHAEAIELLVKEALATGGEIAVPPYPEATNIEAITAGCPVWSQYVGQCECNPCCTTKYTYLPDEMEAFQIASEAVQVLKVRRRKAK